MEFLNTEQLDDIIKHSIPLPLYFVKDSDMEKILQVISLTDFGPNTLMGVPEYLELEKYNSTGIITTARYVLADSYKAHESKFEGAPEDN